MKYVGVDIGKFKHAASAIDGSGACVMKPRFFTQDTGGLASLCGSLGKLALQHRRCDTFVDRMIYKKSGSACGAAGISWRPGYKDATPTGF